MSGLSDNNYMFAVMVHKLFQNRVQEFLASSGAGTDAELLDCPEITGVSRSRRGYKLLLFPETRPSAVIKLSPLARQNISWISRISNCVSIRDKDSVGRILWQSLTEDSFATDTDVLRVGVHPRSDLEFICRSLQRAAGHRENDKTDDEYEGPIELTPSRTRCTYRLTVIFKETAAEDSPENAVTNMYWGIDQRPEHDALIDLPLNHEATDEIPIVPCDSRTGFELDGRMVDAEKPLSRAYYKLEQVYREYLASTKKSLEWDCGIGLDLGASPGGWTQVLVHLFGLASVVAVDAAAIANRVGELPQVRHLRSKMEDTKEFPKGPYSIVACDACLLWMELFDVLCDRVIHSIQCCLPSVWVMTMKLPFRSPGSIRRHLQLLGEGLDGKLTDMAQVLYPNKVVEWKSQLVHLMANSDSERTLLVTFQAKSE